MGSTICLHMIEYPNACAFAPGHITGFFKVHNSDNPKSKGSVGCGLVINGGIESEITLMKKTTETVIFLNENKIDSDIIQSTIKQMTDTPLMIKCRSDIPIGYGYGASGASAISTSFALNKLLSLNMSHNELINVAHEAEIQNNSGLGDVFAQSIGGVVIRKKPGIEGLKHVDRIPSLPYDIFCLTFDKISTSSILNDNDLVNDINVSGDKAIKQLLKQKTVSNFMKQSLEFSRDSGLLDTKAGDVIEKINDIGGLASQAMLGNTVFAIATNEHNKKDIIGVMEEYGDILIYRINHSGPKMVEMI